MSPTAKKKRKAMLTWIVVAAVGIALVAGGLYYYLNRYTQSGRWAFYAEIRANPETFAQYSIPAGGRCDGAPFAFPTRGVILGLWDQSYHFGHRHAGIDIFSGSQPGVTPVYAAYPGYLSRLPDWRASLIIRIPSDPLNPGRQIWTYYTHLANVDGQSFISADFPAGTSEKYVEAGTLLGYMGDFSGDPGSPTGLHLHFSVVKDEDGHFLNELRIGNTYDPSLYFNLALNHRENPDEIPLCAGSMTVEDWNFVDEQ